MKIIDPGHRYTLGSLDGPQENELVFVKREGEGYPGNVGSHPGTTCQEVLRAIADRLRYVNKQIPCSETTEALGHIRRAIMLMENRAARRHSRPAQITLDQAEWGPTCEKCGHVGCEGECHP